jgi:hypothetical protein
MKKPLIALCVVIIVCSIFAVSLLQNQPSINDNAQPTTQTTPQTSPQTPANSTIDSTLQNAITNAVNFLKQTQDPTGLLMLNVLYRQFGITEFNTSLQSFDQILDSNHEPINRVFRRIADHNNQVYPDDFKAVTDQLDRVTVPALYSDVMELPDNYLERLTNARDDGFYYAQKSTENSGCYLLTHALLAVIWLEENNCDLQLPDDFKETLYMENAGLIGDGSKVNDIQLEAAAFLYEGGQGDLVSDEFVQNVLAAQFIDGGWAISQDVPSNTYWHPTVLALMILLHVAYPAQEYPPMLA